MIRGGSGADGDSVASGRTRAGGVNEEGGGSGADGVNGEMGMGGAGGNNGGEAGAEGVRGVVGFIGDEDWFTGLIIIFSMSSRSFWKANGYFDFTHE